MDLQFLRGVDPGSSSVSTPTRRGGRGRQGVLTSFRTGRSTCRTWVESIVCLGHGSFAPNSFICCLMLLDFFSSISGWWVQMVGGGASESEAQPSWAGVGQLRLVHPGAGLTRGPGARCSSWSRVALTCRGPPPLAPEQL